MESGILEKAKRYLKEENFEKVQIILRRALNENPNNPNVLEIGGDLAVKLNRDDDAITRYEHASENYTHRNQFAEAIVCLEKIMKIDPTNESVISRLADLYRFYGLANEAIKKILDFCSRTIEQKEYALLISGLRKIVEMQPKNLSLRLSFAKLLLAINRTQEAQDELKKLKMSSEETGDDAILNEIKKLSPQPDGGDELDPKSRVELGNLLYEIGSKDEAIIEFSRAVSDLLAENKADEALTILNRIVEIDPNNAEALAKISSLKNQPAAGAAKPVEPPPIAADITSVIVPEYIDNILKENGAVPAVDEPVERPQIQDDLEILQALGKEGFNIPEDLVAETKDAPEQPAAEPVNPALPAEAIPMMEGQIADIEFLLKDAESFSLPSFELAQQFDEFRNNIAWEKEDTVRKIELAKIAFNSNLYEAALRYIKDDKNNKGFWPTSLEIIGASLVKLGLYNDAIKTIGPTILLEDIPEDKKTELRYILASAYEGLGDFENALRETEHIIAVNPNYRDVREIYQLLGGKPEFIPAEPPPAPVVKEAHPAMKEEPPPPVVDTKAPPPAPVDQGEYPIIIEEEVSSRAPSEMPFVEEMPAPKPPVEPPVEKVPEKVSDLPDTGENITFL